MKKVLCSFAVILFAMAVSAQNADKSGRSPEFSLKAFVSTYHGSYEVMAGARVGDNVFGLGSGLGLEYWDAYPADVRKVTMCVIQMKNALRGLSAPAAWQTPEKFFI